MANMLRAALPLAILIAPLSLAEARTADQEITVTAPSMTELRAWTARTGKAINEQMRYPARLGIAPDPEGLVDVTFMCSEDGTPTKVALARSSGSSKLDRAGIRAVERVKSLHPLPAGIGPDQVYRAKLMFAVDDGSTGTAKRLAALRDKGNLINDALVQRRGRLATASVVTLVPAGAP